MNKTVIVPLCQVAELKELLAELQHIGCRTGEYECTIDGAVYTFVFECDTMTFNECLDDIG
jgi:hypothetical protein